MVSTKVPSLKQFIDLLLLFLMASLAGSCATYTPRDIDCSSYNQKSVENPNQRVAGRGFSVLPPAGDGWCISIAGDSAIVFMSNKFIGEYVEKIPTLEQQKHTFTATALRYSVENSDITSRTAFLKFMERWLENSQINNTVGSELYAVISPKLRNYNTLDFHVEIEDSVKSDCVRFQIESEEVNNPGAPGWVLIQTSEGIACRHPFSRKMFVSVEFSERRRKGHEDSDVRDRLREQADVMLESLELTPLMIPKTVDPDLNPEQLRNLEKLASGGDAKAQFELSYYLYNTDRMKSFAWLCESAMQRLNEAQIALGSYYEFGVTPVEQDYSTALMWYLLGSPARRHPAYLLKKEMTRSQIDQAEQMARDWKPGDCSSAEHRLKPLEET